MGWVLDRQIGLKKGRNPTDRAGSQRDLWCEGPSCYHRRQRAGAIWGISVKTIFSDNVPWQNHTDAQTRRSPPCLYPDLILGKDKHGEARP